MNEESKYIETCCVREGKKTTINSNNLPAKKLIRKRRK